MISPSKIAEISDAEGIGWAIVEKDYFLTLLLDAVANTPRLDENLVFNLSLTRREYAWLP